MFEGKLFCANIMPQLFCFAMCLCFGSNSVFTPVLSFAACPNVFTCFVLSPWLAYWSIHTLCKI